MRLVEIWDYFMRRKRLLLAIMVMLIALIVLAGRISSGRADNTTDVEIPRTGEVVSIESETVGCDTSMIDWSGIALGNGENQAEENTESALDNEVTFWGAEAPAAMIKAEDLGVKNGEKAESMIITLGILATIAVLGVGKFLFDHYVR